MLTDLWRTSRQTTVCRPDRPHPGKREDVVRIDLGRLDRIVEIDRESGVITVEAGVPVETIRAVAEDTGQWCPALRWLPGDRLIGAALAGGHGRRSRRYGAIGDYVLGTRFICPSVGLIRHGGKAIKNASGYNLSAAVVGSRGAFGVIVEAIIRLVPRPAARAVRLFRFDPEDIWSAAQDLLALTPGLDAMEIWVTAPPTPARLLIEIEDPAQAVVERRLDLLTEHALARGATIEDRISWPPAPDQPSTAVRRFAVDPAELAALGLELGRRVPPGGWLLAEATGGALELRGDSLLLSSEALGSAILARSATDSRESLRATFKAAFDPRGLLVDAHP